MRTLVREKPQPAVTPAQMETLLSQPAARLPEATCQDDSSARDLAERFVERVEALRGPP